MVLEAEVQAETIRLVLVELLIKDFLVVMETLLGKIMQVVEVAAQPQQGLTQQ